MFSISGDLAYFGCHSVAWSKPKTLPSVSTARENHPILGILTFVGTMLYNQATTRLIGEANNNAKQSLLPHFQVNREVMGLNTPSSSESIIFRNIGGVCYNPRAQIISLLEVGITQGSSTNVYRVPLDGYFDWRETSSTCSVTFTDQNAANNYYVYNEAAVMKIHAGVVVLASTKGINAFALPTHFVKMDYQDIFGATETEYYMFSVADSGKKLDPADGTQVFLAYNNREKHFDLKSTPKEILDYVLSQSPDYSYKNK